MKMIAIAFAVALAGIGSAAVEPMRAQSQDSIVIKDQIESQAYANAIGLADPKAKALALESFLKTYPDSLAKRVVLGDLVDLYLKPLNADREVSASSRLFAADPANLRAAYFAVWISSAQGTKSNPPDDKALGFAADTARKALAAQRPEGTTEAEWKKQTDAGYPMFHSAIALNAALQKDFKTAINEYNIELKFYSLDDAKSSLAVTDSFHLAQAYAQSSPPDELNAIWFFARAWTNAQPTNRATIEQQLDYWYKTYHGGLDGLDDIKKLAAASVFPPDTFTIAKAPSLAEIIHRAIAANGNAGSSLADEETVLAAGLKEDADRVWAKLKDQTTPVPGTVIAADVSAMKVTVSQSEKTSKLIKTTSYTVKLSAPITCEAAESADGGVKGQELFILENGFKEDTEQLAKIFAENSGQVKKIVLDPTVSTIKVAVTADARNGKMPDFVVNLKEPVSCKHIPKAGLGFGMQPAIELDGTYDSYVQNGAAEPSEKSVQIVLRDGFIQAEKKGTAVRKPAASAQKAAHT